MKSHLSIVPGMLTAGCVRKAASLALAVVIMAGMLGCDDEGSESGAGTGTQESPEIVVSADQNPEHTPRPPGKLPPDFFEPPQQNPKPTPDTFVFDPYESTELPMEEPPLDGLELHQNPIPAPGAFVLGSIGLAYTSWKLRRRKDS